MVWKREWFYNIPKYQVSHWNSLVNQRAFIGELREQFSITSSLDWRKISSTAIMKLGGRVESNWCIESAGIASAV